MTTNEISYSCSPVGGAGIITITERYHHESHCYRIELTCPTSASHPIIETIRGYVRDNPQYVMSLRLCEQEYMARTAWGMGKDGGETLVHAFCWLIQNRVNFGGGCFGDTIGEVCQQPGEFHCWDKESPIRPQMIEAHHSDGGTFAHANQIALDVLSQADYRDPIGGAMYFCDPAHLSNVANPTGIRIVGRMAFFHLADE